MIKIHICPKCSEPMMEVYNGWYCAICKHMSERPPGKFWPAVRKWLKATIITLALTGICFYGYTTLSTVIKKGQIDRVEKKQKEIREGLSIHKHLVTLEDIEADKITISGYYLEFIKDRIEKLAYRNHLEIKNISINSTNHSVEVECTDKVWDALWPNQSYFTDGLPKVSL